MPNSEFGGRPLRLASPGHATPWEWGSGGRGAADATLRVWPREVFGLANMNDQACPGPRRGRGWTGVFPGAKKGMIKKNK